MMAGIDSKCSGATLGWTAIDAPDIAVGELSTAGGEVSVPKELVLSIAMAAAKAIPVGIDHREEETGGVGNAERVPISGIGLGKIPRIPEHEHGPSLVLKFVGGFPGIIVGADRDDKLGGPAWTGLSP